MIPFDELLVRLREANIRLWLEEGEIRYRAPKGAMTPALADHIAEHKDQLRRALQAAQPTLDLSAPELKPRPRPAYPPLSFAQERMWFLHQLEGDRPAYNVFKAFHLAGPLVLETFKDSLEDVIARHETLRMTFPDRGGVPYQRISPSGEASMPILNLQGMDGTDRQRRIKELCLAVVNEPYDLAKGPLLRTRLLQLDAQEFILLLAMHHIITDGWSIDIMLTEIVQAYERRITGSEEKAAPLPVQYTDFSLWQRAWLTDENLAPYLEYWEQELEGAPEVVTLTPDHPRPPEMSFRGGMIPINFGDELSASVHELATRTGSTSFMVILAGLAALLHRYTGMQDIVIGTPVANRTHLDLEGMIGFFVNSLPVRFDLSGEPTFEQLLAQTRTKTLQALTYQNLPFELLVKRMHIERDLSRHPIFQVIVSMRVGPGHPTIMDAVEIETYPLDTEVSRFDINLMLWQQGAQVSGHWEFSTDLYNRTTIERFSQHFLRFLKNVVSNPQQTISNILLIDEDEQKRLLSQTRTPATFTPPVACIHEKFEAQVDRTPHAVAVEYEGETLTYHALNQHANRLAHLLIDRGVRPDQMVGLCVQPSLNLVVAILGILKAGGAYVPLDPNYPLRRLQFMLDDASIDLVVSEEASRSKIMRKGTSILALDSEADRIAAMPDENPKVNVKPDNLAYVIYTSGSTGQPKGALIAHSNVIQLFEGSEESCRFGPDDTWALFHSFTFDFSVWELFGALFYGGRLIVIPVSMRRSLDTYFKKVVFKRLTILAMIPPLFFEAALMPQFFDRLAGSKLRHIFLGGDVLDVSKLAPFFQRDGAKPIRITNVYGPTETTVFVTWHEVSRKDLDQASGSIIGRPLDGASIFIFDSHLNLLPVGVPGEIVVGGLGVSRGYLNRPELDHQRFIEHPLDPRPDSRFYRTGDVGRIRADGELEYLGRQDDQVKIRGFRVETGEIEVVLAQHEAVQGCVVKVGKEHQADETLWAYVAPKEGMSLTKQDLESYLGSQLPEYMLPNRYFILDKIPLTSTGKIDRSALSGGAYEELSDSGGYVAPRDPLESQIAAIWEQILGVQPVGRNDNFFDLGGHSLLALQLLSALRIATGVDLSVAALFQAPTVAKQARLIKKREWKPSGLALIPIQEGGRGKPIFFVHWAGGSVLVYRKLIQLLDPTLRIYGLQAYGMDRSVRPHTRIEQMAAHYVSEIRELQPKGPYYLAGASMGGSIAFEMARQLRDDGEEVGLVALFDTIGGPNLGTLPLRERVQLHADNIRERQSALGYLWERTVIRLRRMLYAAVIGLGIPLPHRMWNLKETTYYAFKHYRPGVYSGNVVLFRATERGPGIPKSAFLGWEKVVSGGISIVDVPGKHSTVLSAPGVRVVAKNLDVLLADAKEAVRPGSKPEETSS